MFILNLQGFKRPVDFMINFMITLHKVSDYQILSRMDWGNLVPL